jgi:hypothetical protein
MLITSLAGLKTVNVPVRRLKVLAMVPRLSLKPAKLPALSNFLLRSASVVVTFGLATNLLCEP